MDDDTFAAVLEEANGALERAKIGHVLMGGVASAMLGRPRYTLDLDIFVRPDQAERALEALAGAGFDTQQTNPHWIYKALRRGVLVDLIFRAKGELFLDDEMVARAKEGVFHGARAKVMPVEDLLVVKAIINDEPANRHWFDALGLLLQNELDWEYLLRRAQHGPRRVLSLLLYAQSDDLLVPDHVIRSLFATVYPEEPA